MNFKKNEIYTEISKTRNIDNNVERFNITDFEIGERIAKTNFGFISICRRTKLNKMYFLRVINKGELIKTKYLANPYNEYKLLSSIYHPFILELKGVNNTDPYNLFFFGEFFTGANLRLLIKINQNLPIEYIRFFIASIITVFDYLHKKKIIYRDLRPENVLINSEGYIKIVDFFLSKTLVKDFTLTTCGNPEYYSPEMVNQSGYNKCVDFWQLGILLYEMTFGYTPFFDSDPVKLIQKIKKGKVKFPKNANKNIKNMIKHLLNIDIYKRMGCTKKGIYEIIQHPFFEGFDWEALLHRNLQVPYIPKTNLNIFNCIYKKLEELHLENNCVAIPKEKDPFYNW
jgi:serine/threonine protein kinase